VRGLFGYKFSGKIKVSYSLSERLSSPSQVSSHQNDGDKAMNLLTFGYLAAFVPSLVALAWLAWRVPTIK
jgi:hypothetical protein